MRVFSTKKILFNLAWLSFITLFACRTDFDEIRHSDGNANFARVVAIGGSHLAGYADRALYLEAQSNSIPAILASRFQFTNGGPFIQPLVKPGVGIGVVGNSKYVFKWEQHSCEAKFTLRSLPLATTGDLSNYNWSGNATRFNNLSVPNTRIKNITDQTYGNPSPFVGNPLYARFASNPGSSTMSGDALLANPTFAIVWLGMEDIYNYARTGGNEGGDSITLGARFDLLLNNQLEELESQSASGVVLNIPALESVPFFTATAYNGLNLDQAKATQLNALYAMVDSTIKFTAGLNPFVIADPGVPSGRRQIKEGEYILITMPSDSIICHGLGSTVPISGRYVLDSSEVSKIKNAIITYNSSITIAAINHAFVVADINALFKQLENGMMFNGVHYSTKYPEGGVFSTDGIHLSQRGSAIVANEVISTINLLFSAKIPKADVNFYDGIVFP